MAAGAAGVVLDTQLALLRGSSLADATRGHRRSWTAARPAWSAATASTPGPTCGSPPAGRHPPAEVAAAPPGRGLTGEVACCPWGRTAPSPPGWPSGTVVGGAGLAVREAIDDHVEAAAERTRPLAPGNGVARATGTPLPDRPGPMTRVSDTAAFADAVAEGGGLPFLALALLRGLEVRELLDETRERLGDRPWGVGILGFVPPELRDEQLAVIRDVRPPVAIIAGGRPSQAAALGGRRHRHLPARPRRPACSSGS